MPERIPVRRPRLPDADQLLPYLRRIDAARIYTNWGPLATEFEHRLAAMFALPDHGVVSTSSGTSAIVGAILGTAGRASADRPLAMLPAMTFVATAIAVEQCGYQPYFVDVDPVTWRVDLDVLAAHPLLQTVGLMVAVAPFGRPMDQATCRRFQERTAIPVVIDGGGSFESLCDVPERALGTIPTALSFHATKAFGIGEGGCVATSDPVLALRIQQALNFGFHASRDCEIASSNGKLSEYQAAVGLAELDGWPAKIACYRDVARRYAERMCDGLSERLRVTPNVAACYALFESPDAAWSRRAQRALSIEAIEWRLWYGEGVHRHAHFSDAPRDPVPTTETLLPRLIGLPMALDLGTNDIARIAATIASVGAPHLVS
jgi:dTDP-4-amino-4,6-dideoxygalactose transaminase